MTPEQRDMLLGVVQEDDDSSAASDLLAIVALLILAAAVRVLGWFDADAATDAALRATVEQAQEVRE